MTELSGSVDADDAIWLASWVIRRVVERVRRGRHDRLDSAFLKFLVDCVEEFEARRPLDPDSKYSLKQQDAELVRARARLAAVFRAEKRHPRLLRKHRAWGRIVALGTGGRLPPLDGAALREVSRFDALGKPTDDAARLLETIFHRSKRIQDAAKARLKGAPPRRSADDGALLGFFVRCVLGRSPRVRDAVVAAFNAAAREEAQSVEP